MCLVATFPPFVSSREPSMQRTLCQCLSSCVRKFSSHSYWGFLQDWCLSICPDSARAAHPRLQENIWQTDRVPNLCLLLIHQLEAPDVSNCEQLISLTPIPHASHPTLPATIATEQAAAQIPTEACIDDCRLMTLKSVWYVCTQGEISAKIFHRAKALLHTE